MALHRTGSLNIIHGSAIALVEQHGPSIAGYHSPSTCIPATASVALQYGVRSSMLRFVWTRHINWTRLTLRAVNDVASKPAKSPAEEDWKVKREMLLKSKVRSVSAKEALRLQQDHEYIILDVRPIFEFNQAHAKGAINIEIYRLIKEWTPWDVARRLGFAFFGIFSGTEENPNFLSDVVSQLDPSSRIIVACASGGTTKPSASLSEGQQSRSLIAAYILVLNGYKNVLHLEGGLRNWFKEELPVESSL